MLWWGCGLAFFYYLSIRSLKVNGNKPDVTVKGTFGQIQQRNSWMLKQEATDSFSTRDRCQPAWPFISFVIF